MTEVDQKLELFAEGLKSYPAAREAIRAFEELVSELARQVMIRHLDELGRVTGQSSITEHDIIVQKDAVPPPSVGVGAQYNAPDTWGIRWGIKWVPPQPSNSAQLEAFVSVRVGSLKVQDNIFKNLSLTGVNEDKGVHIEKVDGRMCGWGCEVQVCIPITPNVSLEEAEELIDRVVSSFLDMASRAGGISALLNNPATSDG